MSDVIWDYLLDLLRKPGCQEIFINGLNEVCLVDGDGVFRDFSSPFRSLGEMIELMQVFALEHGVRLDPQVAYASGDFGSCDTVAGRWVFCIPPLASPTPVICLRRHQFHHLSLADFANGNRLVTALKDFPVTPPLFFCGTTGRGKTSLMVTLLKEQFFNQRVLFLENSPEIPLVSKSWIRLVAKPPCLQTGIEITLQSTLEAGLRLRPEAIVVSEVRGVEARCLAQAVMAGNGSVFSTLHLGNPKQLAQLLTQISNWREWENIFCHNPPLVVMMKETGSIGLSGIYSWLGRDRLNRIG